MAENCLRRDLFSGFLLRFLQKLHSFQENGRKIVDVLRGVERSNAGHFRAFVFDVMSAIHSPSGRTDGQTGVTAITSEKLHSQMRRRTLGQLRRELLMNFQIESHIYLHLVQAGFLRAGTLKPPSQRLTLRRLEGRQDILILN